MSTGKMEKDKSIEFRRRFVAMCGTANPRVIADYLGISYQAAKNYLGGRMPEPKILLKFAEKSPVSIHWLLTGEGEKYVSRSAKTEAEMLASVLSDLADAATLRKIFEYISEAKIDSALEESSRNDEEKGVRTVRIKSSNVRKQKVSDSIPAPVAKEGP